MAASPSAAAYSLLQLAAGASSPSTRPFANTSTSTSTRTANSTDADAMVLSTPAQSSSGMAYTTDDRMALDDDAAGGWQTGFIEDEAPFRLPPPLPVALVQQHPVSPSQSSSSPSFSPSSSSSYFQQFVRRAGGALAPSRPPSPRHPPARSRRRSDPSLAPFSRASSSRLASAPSASGGHHQSSSSLSAFVRCASPTCSEPEGRRRRRQRRSSHPPSVGFPSPPSASFEFPDVVVAGSSSLHQPIVIDDADEEDAFGIPVDRPLSPRSYASSSSDSSIGSSGDEDPPSSGSTSASSVRPPASGSASSSSRGGKGKAIVVDQVPQTDDGRKPPFDHREPYKYYTDPFSLDNAPELEDPEAAVFPLAIHEEDPDIWRFPLGSLPPQGDMAKGSGNGAGSAPNQNLVGHCIDSGRLELMSILGLGAYGVVYLARDLTSPDFDQPRLFAVKALTKVGLDARQRSFQRREIALHSLASSHPSVVTLHAVIETPSCIFVVLDYCPDGDLFGMITEQQRYLGHEDRIRSVLLQIIGAVEHCHSLGIAHRDLKPENILCKRSGDEVVLADFGLATAEHTSADFGCGSTFYMSPECQGGIFERLGSYSTLHNDIWSLGVILVNLTCGRNPWKQACPTDETFRAYLQNPDFLRSILPLSQSCNDLLKRIFALNPLSRISLAELKAEVIRMPTFTMSAEELRTATRATREAARAWQEVPSPRPAQGNWEGEVKRKKDRKAEAATRKAAAKEAAKEEAERRAKERRIAEREAYKAHAEQTIDNRHGRQVVGLQEPSSFGALRSSDSVWSEESATPRAAYVTPPSTPHAQGRSSRRSSLQCDEPLATAFSSASLSDDEMSSPYEGRPKSRRTNAAAPSRRHPPPISFADPRHPQQVVFPPTPSTPNHPGRKHAALPPTPTSASSRYAAPTTPTHHQRRRRGESEGGSGGSSSSSSGTSWIGLPATPQSPCFAQNQVSPVLAYAGSPRTHHSPTVGDEMGADYAVYAAWAASEAAAAVAAKGAKQALQRQQHGKMRGSLGPNEALRFAATPKFGAC